MADYQIFRSPIRLVCHFRHALEELTKIKGIASIETNFALGSVKTKQPLPIN